MKTMLARVAKNDFGQMIETARSQMVPIEKHGVAPWW